MHQYRTSASAASCSQFLRQMLTAAEVAAKLGARLKEALSIAHLINCILRASEHMNT